MASEGKKILMFDETTGMLTKEVMLAYVHGELSASVREEVEKFLASDEMHRDIMEGLRQVPDKNQVDSAIHAINERVVERTGAELSTGGYSFEVPQFLTDYRKIAAIIIGVLLILGITFSLMLINESSPGIASSEKESTDEKSVTEERLAAPSIMEPTPAITSEPSPGLITGTRADTSLDGQGGDQPVAAGSTFSSTEKNTATANNNKATTKEITAEKRPSVAADAGQVISKDNKQTDSVTSAMNYANTATMGTANDGENTIDALRVTTIQESKIQKSEEEADKTKLTLDETMPEFPGGESALHQYLHNNLQYPKDAKEKGIEGKVYLTFTIGTSGRVKDIRVAKGVSKDINAEAIRLISNMPSWTPGKQKGKPAAMKHYLTIDFSLE